MSPTIRYFAAAASAAGKDEETWPSPRLTDADPDHPLTLAEVREELAARYGAPMQKVLVSGSFLVDGVARTDDGPVAGDVVDVLPPFAGG